MNSLYDYESLGQINFRRHQPERLTEAFGGTAVVGWHGRIERQLVNMLNDAEKGRNYPYGDKIREFLKIWRANEITGSINRETIEILKSAADILSVDRWDFSAYFGSLKDQLKILIASEEQLPRGMEEPGNDPMAGAGGGGPPMSPSFGAGKGGPEDAGGMPGGPEGGAGGAGGAPGPEGMPGGPEGAPGEAGGPEGGPGEPPPGEGEAPGAEPGAPAPGEDANDQPKPEDMPGGDLGQA